MSNFFCAAPWRGLHINPRGDVKTCCAGDPNMLGNLNTQTIEEILQGPTMQEIRQSIRQGQPHAYCYNCVQAERYGRSERDWHNSLNPDIDYQTVSDYYPVLIDLRWNTTCNLSCNYCGEACSSKWASLKQIPVKSGARPYYQQVCNYLENHADKIKEVALVGGEPLLLPENEYLLDVMPKDCVVTLITNVSVKLRDNKIFKKLAKRNRVGWSLSFDNIGTKFEYVRHGGNWVTLVDNLDMIQELISTQGHWGGIHAVYNVYNATKLIEFTEFARQRNLTIHWQSLYQPEYLDPTRLGKQMFDLARSEIINLLSKKICLDSEQQFFENVLANFTQRDDLRKDFSEHILNIETKYHQDHKGNFRQWWPELGSILCK